MPAGRVILVVATRPEPGAPARPGLDLVVHEPLEHARLALDEIGVDGTAPEMDVVVVDEAPSQALATVAREHDADEIAIGGAPRYGDGNVAADLLGLVDRPVVVLR